MTTLPRITYNRQLHRVWIPTEDDRDDVEIPLRGKKLLIIHALASHPTGLSKDTLFKLCWGKPVESKYDLAKVDSVVSDIRGKIGKHLLLSEKGGIIRIPADVVDLTPDKDVATPAAESETETPRVTAQPEEAEPTGALCKMCEATPALADAGFCERCLRISADHVAGEDEEPSEPEEAEESPTIAPEHWTDPIIPDALKGEIVVIAGALTRPRKVIEQTIVAAGGGYTAGITENTTMVIAGRHAGKKKAEAAKNGIRILTEDSFIGLITNTDDDAAQVAAPSPTAEKVPGQVYTDGTFIGSVPCKIIRPEQVLGERVADLQARFAELDQRVDRLEYPIVKAAQGLRGLKKILDGLAELAEFSETFADLHGDEDDLEDEEVAA